MANIQSVNRIMTAKDHSGSARAYIRKIQQDIHRGRGVAVTIRDLDAQEPTGVPVYAKVLRGMWVAECECRGMALVDPDEPIYFCFECLNRSNGSKPRPVIFPPEAERKEIERLLLERPVNDIRGLTDLDRAANAEPLLYVQRELVEPEAGQVTTLPLPRSWEPGETIADLRAQQDEPLRKWHTELREGRDVIQQ